MDADGFAIVSRFEQFAMCFAHGLMQAIFAGHLFFPFLNGFFLSILEFGVYGLFMPIILGLPIFIPSFLHDDDLSVHILWIPVVIGESHRPILLIVLASACFAIVILDTTMSSKVMSKI